MTQTTHAHRAAQLSVPPSPTTTPLSYDAKSAPGSAAAHWDQFATDANRHLRGLRTGRIALLAGITTVDGLETPLCLNPPSLANLFGLLRPRTHVGHPVPFRQAPLVASLLVTAQTVVFDGRWARDADYPSQGDWPTDFTASARLWVATTVTAELAALVCDRQLLVSPKDAVVFSMLMAQPDPVTEVVIALAPTSPPASTYHRVSLASLYRAAQAVLAQP